MTRTRAPRSGPNLGRLFTWPAICAAEDFGLHTPRHKFRPWELHNRIRGSRSSVSSKNVLLLLTVTTTTITTAISLLSAAAFPVVSLSKMYGLRALKWFRIVGNPPGFGIFGFTEPLFVVQAISTTPLQKRPSG